MINSTQNLIFDLIRTSSLNNFNANKVVDYLIENKKQWIGVLPEVVDYTLRDIDTNTFHIDTILVRCEDEKTANSFLKELEKNCLPDEINILPDLLDFKDQAKVIISMWWD